jgi:hypothetical protein
LKTTHCRHRHRRPANNRRGKRKGRAFGRGLFIAEIWSGRRGSNPQPTAWEAATLPLSYSRLSQNYTCGIDPLKPKPGCESSYNHTRICSRNDCVEELVRDDVIWLWLHLKCTSLQFALPIRCPILANITRCTSGELHRTGRSCDMRRAVEKYRDLLQAVGHGKVLSLLLNISPRQVTRCGPSNSSTK